MCGEPGVGRQLRSHNRQVIFARECEVAFITRGHRHDGACAITHEHIVSNPHGHRLASDRVDGRRAGEHTGFFARVRLPVGISDAGRHLAIRIDCGALLWGGECINERMLRRQHHEGCAKQRVGSRGEHFNITGTRCKAHPRTFAAANPVALHDLDRLGPVEAFEVVEQAVGICRDAHRPLPHVAFEDGIVADVAATIGGDFFICQDGAEPRAPVDGRIGQISQTVVVHQLLALARRHCRPCGATRRASTGFEFSNQFGDGSRLARALIAPRVKDLKKNPLRPAIERFVGGADAASGVVGQPESSQLATHVGDVGLGVFAGVHARGDGVLFGGQPERVVAKCMQHVVASHTFEASVYVGGDVAERVADMQPSPRRVGEHVEDEQFLAPSDFFGLSERPSRVRGVKGVCSLPAVLPFGLNLGCQAGVVALFWQGIAGGHLHLA